MKRLRCTDSTLQKVMKRLRCTDSTLQKVKGNKGQEEAVIVGLYVLYSFMS